MYISTRKILQKYISSRIYIYKCIWTLYIGSIRHMMTLYCLKKALSTVENTPCTRWTQLVKGVVQGGRNLSKGVVQVDANRKNVPKIRYKFDQ